MGRGNGEGNIKKRKDGRWEARYTLGTDTEGKVIRKSVYGKTRQEVATKLSKVLSNIGLGMYIEPTKITVSDWLDTWFETYKKPTLKPKTYESYESLARVHIKPEIGNIPLKDLRPEHLQHLYNTKTEKGFSSRTVKYIHTVIHGLLYQALRNGLVARNVSEATTLPKQKKNEIKVLSVEEQNKFIEALKGERLAVAFILDLATGLRRGELLALRWSDIDFEKGTLKVSRNLQRIKNFDIDKTELVFGTPKTEKGYRTIPLLDDIIKLLKQHKSQQNKEKLKSRTIYNNNNLVFCSGVGTTIDPDNLVRVLDRIIKKIKIEPISFHALRHTFASRALENDIPPKVVQEILGHSSITMTMDIYTHLMPETKQTEMSKLKNIFKEISL